MGQYHTVVNLTKGEFISAHGLCLGAKAVEQLHSSESTQEALFMLLMCSNGRGGGDVQANDPYSMVGRWAGDQIAVIGDYTENDDIKGVDTQGAYSKCVPHEPSDLEQLGGAADGDLPQPKNGNYLDITPYLRPLMESQFGLKYKKISEGGYSYFSRKYEDEE